MKKVSRSLSDIAVLRGGSKNFEESLKEGAEILKSLSNIGYQPLDVLIDVDGGWTLHGQPTDAHYIYTLSHTVIDATRMRGEAYQDLAKRMGLPLLFSNADRICMDREDMYRLLRQQGFKVPDTTVIRSKAPIQPEQLHSIWRKYHTPLMLRPLTRTKNAPSKLITSFHDLENTVTDYHDKGVDMHVLTYRDVPTSSVAVMPNFRNEELYTPLWVETFSGTKQLPNNSSTIRAYTRAPDFRKEQVKKIVEKVYKALDLSGPACIDMIPYKNDYIIVNIETEPSLRPEGRFMKSLETTGVNNSQCLISRILNELER